MPAARVPSLSIRRGRPASAAGVNSAVPSPHSAAPAIISGSESALITSMKARKRMVSAATAHVRQPMRSTSAPSTGPKRIDGSRSGSRTAAIAHGVLKRS